MWPVSGAPTGWPVAASHTRTVLSRLPETMRSPSGLNAALRTASVWPVSGGPTGWPVAASHTRTVLSALPETIRSPSGLNATVFTSDGSSTILIRWTIPGSALSSGPSSGACASLRAATSCW